MRKEDGLPLLHSFFKLAPPGYNISSTTSRPWAWRDSFWQMVQCPTQTGSEGEIRKALIEADLVDCMVALSGQLFFTTQIPVCLWFLARDKKNHKRRDRRGETLFIDARKMGTLVDRIHRELTAEEIKKVSDCYHAWKSKDGTVAAVYDRRAPDAKKDGAHRAPLQKYADEPGFCKSVKLQEIQTHDFVLTPGRYVGAADVEDDGETPMSGLTKQRQHGEGQQRVSSPAFARCFEFLALKSRGVEQRSPGPGAPLLLHFSPH